MVTLKADDSSRLKLPDVEPGQVFACETDGKMIKLTPVPAEEEVPTVKPIKGPGGLYMFPEGNRLTREQIARSLRAERAAQ